MALPVKRIFVHGFPGLYGGASTELHHQIVAWKHMGLEVHLIPSSDTYKDEPLYNEMVEMGVKVHEAEEWSALQPGDPVLGFCNAEFLENLKNIRKHTRRTVFVNCMTWLFEKERAAMSEGLISMFLYQNDVVRERHESELRCLNRDPVIRFLAFKPYFDSARFPFVRERSSEFFWVWQNIAAGCRQVRQEHPSHL